MKICYLDAFSGISGDMLVGALADAGAETSVLVQALSSLAPGAEIRFEKTMRRGISATKFHVGGGDNRKHRHLPAILAMIEQSALPAPVKRDSSAVFQRLGEVEAAVHQVPIEKVHFHEVGAIDSIADIVGACLGIHMLGVDSVYCSPVNVGSGTAETEHGTLPVPAPATAGLLAGKPIYARGPSVELTTPTGAAIAVSLSESFGALPPMKISTIGYGAGVRDFKEQPNVLRVLVGEPTGAVEAATVSVIEANVDDVTPQVLGFAMERLFESGALDVSFCPVFMKKNRPGTLIRVIARPEDRERLSQILFAETTTLGVRIIAAERRVQSRRMIEVETQFGKVRVKLGESGAFAPEYEDCRTLARQAGVPLKQVLAEANLAYLRTQK